MYLEFNKERWLKDKEYFKDTINLKVDLMDKVKDYFFGFITAPVDLYLNQHIEASSQLFQTEGELVSYIKEQYKNKVKLILYCIYYTKEGMVLRSSVLPDIYH